MLDEISRIFAENVPFTKHLQLKVTELTAEKVKIIFPMSTHLIGNFITNRLHGGVAATVLDSAGGILAMANVFYRALDQQKNVVLEDISKTSTVDLRIDYLNAGKGQEFIARGHILRAGNRIITVQLTLHNETDEFIAAGIGTYTVARVSTKKMVGDLP